MNIIQRNFVHPLGTNIYVSKSHSCIFFVKILEPPAKPKSGISPARVEITAKAPISRIEKMLLNLLLKLKLC